MRLVPVSLLISGILLVVAAAWMWNPIAGVAATGLVVASAGLFIDYESNP